MGLGKLAHFLKEKRVNVKMTQAEVAEALGYASPQFVSNWERGLSYPPIETLKELTKIYRADVHEVFDILLKASMEDLERDLRVKFFTEKKSRRSK